MNIGLIDVDGHHFPNLALMRISAYHKAAGDAVEWWQKEAQYDKVYMSKIFSDAYSKDIPTPENTKEVYRGGTGYAISLGQDGKEHFNKAAHADLPPEIESCFPDYSIYPEYDFAVSMTSRGCPRGCSFCHVQAKEGCKSYKCADVWNFYDGQKEIKVLDPNLTACRDKRELFSQYKATGAKIDFTQGLDIRLLNGQDLEDLNAMRLATIHFAWDNPVDDLEQKFKDFAQGFRRKNPGMVYVLTNFDSTLEQDLYRIRVLRELNYDPYVMVYDKPHASKTIRHLQRWCNNKIIFKKCPRFEDYDKWIADYNREKRNVKAG